MRPLHQHDSLGDGKIKSYSKYNLDEESKGYDELLDSRE